MSKLFHVEHSNNIEELLLAGTTKIGLNLSDLAISRLGIYFQELCLWNSRVNLTGLKGHVDIVVNLFVDSLAGALALDLAQRRSLIDIGSGGGFPGLPLKIAFPETVLTLIEPKLKKTAFLHHIIGRLNLNDVSVKPQTIQEFEKSNTGNCFFDYVVLKAIKPESIFPSVLYILHRESRVCMYRSVSLGPSVSVFNMSLESEVAYELPYGYGSRVLSILKTDSN